MTSNTIISHFQSCLCFNWSLFVDGTSSPDLGLLGSGEYFHGRDFAQTGLTPPISTLSDRGSIFFLPRSRPSQIGGVFLVADGTSSPDLDALIGGVFSQLGFFADRTSPPISALSDRGSIFTSMFRLSSQHALLTKQDICLSS